MIRAKELMVGDWVSTPAGLRRVKQNFGVDGICTRLAPEYNEPEGWDESEIEPVALTPEILKKNGFYWGNTATEEDFCGAVGCGYPDSGWCFDEGAGEIKIIFPNETDGGLIRLDDQSADRHLELIFVKPIMVHQFQHCLRLCGIEKEIII